jgi:CRP-like cAMP-binding protein
MLMPFRELPGAIPCRFRKGELLIKAGEPTEYVYYLTKGVVYREMTTEKGYESIFSRKRTTDMADSLIGILALYNKTSGNVSKYDFVAHTECVCYRIPKDACMEYLRANPALLEMILSFAMREYTHVLDLFLAKRDGSVGSRLCKVLLNWSKETEEGRIVSRKCTNVEMAKLLSIHKVTVSRMLRALKEDGCIERTGVGLRILDADRLQQYANNELILEYN